MTIEQQKQPITVEATVNAPVDKVWTLWSEPVHIMQWCSASPDWCVPAATNNLHTGGSFSTRMEAKDGSFGFDFGGVYDDVRQHEYIAYTMEDDRKVSITFTALGNVTKISETFDPEQMNPVEMQRGGWQAILDNFKAYAESKA